MRKAIIVFLLFTIHHSLFTNKSYANNIAVSNVTITNQNTSAQTCEIQFDISWENSWKNGINYDVAWVFIKYSTDSGATWSHATLKSTTTNPLNDGLGWSYGTNSDLAILVPVHDPAQSGDKKGAFLQRTANGTGTISSTGVQFVWDWSSDKLSSDGVTAITASTAARVKVFAIEMVYIPTGSFYIGDGNGSAQSLGAFYQTANTAVQIDNTLKGTIKCGNTDYDDAQLETTGIGIDGDGGLDTDNNGAVDNANFPTGYTAFYLMKCEISQGQYRDFLNTLTRTQQNTRVLGNTAADSITNSYAMSDYSVVKYRNFVRCPSSGNGTVNPIVFGCDYAVNDSAGNGIFNESGDGQWIACNWLRWTDVAAYSDWAALRPFTELEYEKVARGPNTPILNEYVWGSTNITQAIGITNSGQSSEVSSNDANCVYGNLDSVQGPLRCGGLTDTDDTREQAGAGYYGNMELSGNLWEICVTAGKGAGRSFAGSHGNGTLSANGNATNTDWPGFVSTEVVDATGIGFRASYWSAGSSIAAISNRSYASTEYASWSAFYGGRCARTAP